MLRCHKKSGRSAQAPSVIKFFNEFGLIQQLLRVKNEFLALGRNNQGAGTLLKDGDAEFALNILDGFPKAWLRDKKGLGRHGIGAVFRRRNEVFDMSKVHWPALAFPLYD